MSVAILHSRAISGMDAAPVTVEAHLANGLPSFTIVGLPETEVKVYEFLQEKEAMAMALIANDSLGGLTTNVPSATGGQPTILGKFCV